MRIANKQYYNGDIKAKLIIVRFHLISGEFLLFLFIIFIAFIYIHAYHL